jgi:hypothetical protein
MNSFQDSVNAKIPAEISPGTASGRTILIRICQRVAPSISGTGPSFQVFSLRPRTQKPREILGDVLGIGGEFPQRVATGDTHDAHAPLREGREKGAIGRFHRSFDGDAGLTRAEADEVALRPASRIELGELALAGAADVEDAVGPGAAGDDGPSSFSFITKRS